MCSTGIFTDELPCDDDDIDNESIWNEIRENKGEIELIRMRLCWG